MKRRASCGSAIVQYGLPMGLMGLVGVLVVVGTPDTGLSASVSKLIGGTLGVSSSAPQNASIQVASFGTQSLSTQQGSSAGGSSPNPILGNGGILPEPGEMGNLLPGNGFGNIGQQPAETGGQTSRFYQLGSDPRGGIRGTIKDQDPSITPHEPAPGYCDNRIGACTTGGTKLPSETGGSMTVPNGGNPRIGGTITHPNGSGYIGHLPSHLLPNVNADGGDGNIQLPGGLIGRGNPLLSPSESAGTSNMTAGGSQNSSSQAGAQLLQDHSLSPNENGLFP